MKTKIQQQKKSHSKDTTSDGLSAQMLMQSPLMQKKAKQQQALFNNSEVIQKQDPEQPQRSNGWTAFTALLGSAVSVGVTNHLIPGLIQQFSSPLLMNARLTAWGRVSPVFIAGSITSLFVTARLRGEPITGADVRQTGLLNLFVRNAGYNAIINAGLDVANNNANNPRQNATKDKNASKDDGFEKKLDKNLAEGIAQEINKFFDKNKASLEKLAKEG